MWVTERKKSKVKRESFFKENTDLYLTKKKILIYLMVLILSSFLQPEVLEQIQNLKELWMDNNSLQILPGVWTFILHNQIIVWYSELLTLQ